MSTPPRTISIQQALESYSLSEFRAPPRKATASAYPPMPNNDIGGASLVGARDRTSLRLQEAIANYPLPAHRTMHLPDNATLKNIKYVDNMATVLSQYCDAFSSEPTNKRGLTCPIPLSSAFSFAGCSHDSDMRTDPHESVATSGAQLRDGHAFSGSMVAAMSSALLSQATTFSDEGFLKWLPSTRLDLAQSRDPDSALIRIDRAVECMPCATTRPVLDAIFKYDFGNIVLQQFAPLCIESEVLLEALVQRAKEGGSFQWATCNTDGDNSVLRCGSDYCTITTGSDSRRSVAGRMTGVDGDPLLDLLAMCNIPEPSVTPNAQNAEDEQCRRRDRAVVSYFYHRLWFQALSANATFIKFTGGNKLIFCFRERHTQTLYVSPVFRVGTPRLLKMECILTIAAFDDACSRAMKLTYLEESGELPFEARQNYDPDPEVDNTKLALSDLEMLCGMSTGRYLPRILQDRSFQWTHKAFDALFNETEVLEIHFAPGDSFHLQLGPSSSLRSPILLRANRSTYTSVLEGSTLKVKVHSQQYHGSSVFLCHLVQCSGTLEDLIPIGLPFIMKFSRKSPLAFERVVLRKLSTTGHEGIVPRCFGGLYSHAELGLSAFAMEHFPDAYPLTVAQSIDAQLKSKLDTWLNLLHNESKIAHGRLTDTHILFNPRAVDRFHVVGWRYAHNFTAADQDGTRTDGASTNSVTNTSGRDILGVSSWIEVDKTALHDVVIGKAIL